MAAGKDSGMSRANQNKAVRQQALREQLSSQGHVQHVLDICNELNSLEQDLDPTQVNRKKIVIDTKLRLINKYLPDVKSVEIKNAEGETFKSENTVIEFIPVGHDD